ncbi:hypothetical protein [Lactococcus lactis]|uniref:hypothetical protein n=1 Tax=Lactococcus lactis TaxID=1358 RepID=UPI003D0DB2A0
MVESFFYRLDNFGDKRLYISSVQRLLDISKKDSIDIVALLTDLNILTMRYQVKIGDTLYEKVYDKSYQIPKTVFDENLCEDIPVSFEKNVFVFFLVNNDE